MAQNNGGDIRTVRGIRMVWCGIGYVLCVTHRTMALRFTQQGALMNSNLEQHEPRSGTVEARYIGEHLPKRNHIPLELVHLLKHIPNTMTTILARIVWMNMDQGNMDLKSDVSVGGC